CERHGTFGLRPGSVEAHLVGRAELCQGSVEVLVDGFDPEFGDHARVGRLESQGCVEAAVPRAECVTAPAALLLEGVDLRVAQHVAREAVRVRASLLLRRRTEIRLAGSLLERLDDALLEQEPPPGDGPRAVRLEWMP